MKAERRERGAPHSGLCICKCRPCPGDPGMVTLAKAKGREPQRSPEEGGLEPAEEHSAGR